MFESKYTNCTTLEKEEELNELRQLIDELYDALYVLADCILIRIIGMKTLIRY